MAIYSFSTDGGDSFDFSFGGDLERSSRPRHAHFRHGDSAYHDRVELAEEGATAVNKAAGASNRLLKREDAGMWKSRQPARGRVPMSHFPKRQFAAALLAVTALVVALPAAAQAGKLSWLDDVVQEVIVEAKAGGKSLVRGGDGARTEIRRAGRLFVTHEADEGLEQLVRRSEELARAGRRVEQPAEALLQARFSRLSSKTRKRSVPSRRSNRPRSGWSSSWARRPRSWHAGILTKPRRWSGGSGPEGLTAVRVFGDDVAEVLVKEGPESLSVLRKAGRGGWSFFTKQVLPHKKKLAAAGVLAAFMANPEKFVDYAGRATEFAVREFARAGIQLASAVSGGAARGLETTIGQTLAAYGLNYPAFRYLGMAWPAWSLLLSFLRRGRAADPLDVPADSGGRFDWTVGRGQLVRSQQ